MMNNALLIGVPFAKAFAVIKPCSIDLLFRKATTP